MDPSSTDRLFDRVPKYINFFSCFIHVLDRGVHAAVQCCAMKLLVPLNGQDFLVEQLNRVLPDSIRVHTMTKVSKNFNAHQNCGKRRYCYLMPTYCMMDALSINTMLNEAMSLQGPIVGAGYEGGYISQLSNKHLSSASLLTIKEKLLLFRLGSENLELLRRTLARYKGTKYFHNFTTDKMSSDANAQRFIHSFTCSEPIQHTDGSEWVLLEVVGQSFLLNQIRRMVGLAIDIIRKATPDDTLDKAFFPSKVGLITAYYFRSVPLYSPH